MLSRRVHGLVLLSLLTVFLIGCGAEAIAPTAPDDASDPRLIHTSLSLGPIEGLTTAWHPIAFLNEDPPQDREIFVELEPGKGEPELVVPLGVDLMFRCGVPTGGVVEWEGASEVDRVGALSTALCRLDSPEVTRVTALLRTANGVGKVSVRLRAIDVDVDDVQVRRPQITVDRLGPADVADNDAAVEAFFDASIADLGSDGDGLVTSVDRFLDLEAVVEPAALAPLVEWSIDGAPRLLSAKARLRLLKPGRHEIRVGSGVGAKTVPITTYSVRIVREGLAALPFQEYLPLTFRAVTTPAGFEDRVRWLASTRHGSAEPALGQGESFTVTFEDTYGASGSWAGVKADHAKADADAAGSSGPEGGLVIESEATSGSPKSPPYNYNRVRAWCRATGANELIHDIGVVRTTPGNPGGPWMAGLTGCRTFAEEIISDRGNYAIPQTYGPIFDYSGCPNSGAIGNFTATGLATVKMSVDNDPDPDTQVITWSGPNFGPVTWLVSGAVIKTAQTANSVTVRAVGVGVGRVIGTASKNGRHCQLIANIPVGP